MSWSNLFALAPELILSLTGLVVLFAPQRAAQALALTALIAGAISLPFLPHGSAFFAGTLQINDLALVFQGLFLGIGLLVALGAHAEPLERDKEFYALLLLATVGMLAASAAVELITLFVSFELASLSTYALTAYTRKARSVEAATKFFIIGALSSALSLYGISLLYGATGTTFLSGLSTATAAPGMAGILKVGMVLLLAGFGFKVTAVPFHFWAPDTYEGAPAPVSALLAAGSKKMGFIVLIKIFFIGLLSLKFSWVPIWGWIALLTMTVGNFSALVQPSVKRMLAYSSIAQAGYILILFPVATAYGLAGGVFHIITHAAATAGAFLIIGVVSRAGLGEDYPAFSGLGKRQPFLAAAMAIFMLSLVGMPPLAGFQSKFVLFSSAVQAGLSDGNSWLIALAVAGVVNSALSLYYYLRVIKVIYAEEPRRELVPANPGRLSVPLGVKWAVGLALAFILVVGLAPGPLLGYLLGAAHAILPGL